jgi:hypothetical protein
MFRSPLSGKPLELGCGVQAELVLNFFAMRLDCLAAKMKLLGNFSRAICGA